MKKIGIIGTPDFLALAPYAGCDFIDLDIPSGAPISLAERHLPKIYCAILRTVLSNAMHQKDEMECIVAEVGEAKCDGARMLCEIIEEVTGIPVIKTRTHGTRLPGPTPISDGNLPLADKLAFIMDGYVAEGLQVPGHMEVPVFEVLPSERFKVAFWGVPPSDLDMLELFPRETKVLGWTRSVEARTPWNLDSELEVTPGLPTVFFAQSFCQKGAVARHLANKYNGLYLDIDERASASTVAKLEAFLQLAVGGA